MDQRVSTGKEKLFLPVVVTPLGVSVALIDTKQDDFTISLGGGHSIDTEKNSTKTSLRHLQFTQACCDFDQNCKQE